MSFTILGGVVSPPIKVVVRGQLAISPEQVESHVQQNASLGLPDFRQLKAASKHLAVIGGGPGLVLRKEQIKNFPGDIWAINGAFGWCKNVLRIEPVFLTVDPHAETAKWAVGVKRALIESRCAPELVNALSGAEVYQFSAGNDVGQIAGMSSTVSVAPHLAVLMGYESVSLFGCDSAFSPHVGTHAYQNEEREELMIVQASGEDYLTALDFYQQALDLSYYIREANGYIKDESGGLLGALINDPEHRVIWLSEAIAKQYRAQHD